jgi:tetratricopeptide (TPR) repeat protein
VAFKELEQLDEAIAAFQTAIDQRPEFADAWRNLGQAFEKQGDIDAAWQSDLRALALQPEDTLLRLSTETLCPIIPTDDAEIDRYWADLDATLTRYEAEDPPVELNPLTRLDGAPPSLTAYHGRDERAAGARRADHRRQPGAVRGPGGGGRAGGLLRGSGAVIAPCLRSSLGIASLAPHG